MRRGRLRPARKTGRDGARPSKNSDSFAGELRHHSVEAFKHSFFPHHFEHVIQTRPNASPAHGDARGMNQIAGFAAKLLRKRLKCGLQRLKIPLVDLCEFFTQRFQMRGRFRLSKNFFYCLRIEFVILGKEVGRPFRNVFEELDLLFHNREDTSQIFSFEMSIFPFFKNGRASSMNRSSDICAMYWPFSQKHLSRSKAALRRLIFSSSNS